MKNISWTCIFIVCMIAFQVACQGVCDASRIEGISGSDHVLVLLDNGTVWTWGSNGCGQCGREISRSTRDNIITSPQMIEGMSNVTAVASAASFSLALKDDGTVWTWGSNSRGQLGRSIESTGSVYQPAMVPGLSNIVAIAASDQMYAVAVKADGTVWAWGDNSFGQLGKGVNDDRNYRGYISSPVMIEGLSNVKDIAVGQKNIFVLKTDGTVWAWGENGTMMGFDGRYTTEPVCTAPRMVSGLTNVASLAIGDNHALALKKDGTVWAWGDDSRGKLGIGSPKYDTPDYIVTHLPVQVPGLNNVTAIHVGKDFSIALCDDGSVWTWGANYDGRLGDGTTADQNTPVRIRINNATLITGDYNTFVVDKEGNIYGSGDDGSGQLGYRPTDNQGHKKFPVKIDFEVGSTHLQPATPGSVVIPTEIEQVQPAPSNQATDIPAISRMITGGNAILVIGVILLTVIVLGFLGYLVVRK